MSREDEVIDVNDYDVVSKEEIDDEVNTKSKY